MPPSRAIAMARRASVTVSMAADTSGTSRRMPSAMVVLVSTSAGTTSEAAGTRQTSSKVSPTVPKRSMAGGVADGAAAAVLWAPDWSNA